MISYSKEVEVKSSNKRGVYEMKSKLLKKLHLVPKLSKKGSSLDAGMSTILKFFGGIATLVVLGFIIIILSGNLDSSTGLDAGSVAANASTNMLNNVSTGVGGFFSNAGTWFTILSVVIIVGAVVVILQFVRGKKGEQLG